jgi:hypothetical protein
MISPKYLELVEKLSSRTEERKIIWQKSSSSGEFKLQLASGTLTIVRYEGDYNNRPFIVINIYNDRGDKIDVIEAEDSTQEFNALEQLYSFVRRSYYRVDETIDSFFDELSTDKIIGVEGKEEEEEDLPF